MSVAILTPAAEPLIWEQLPPLPDPLGVAAPFAGIAGNALLVAGGANFPAGMPWEGGKKAWTDRVWLLDRPDGTWREVGRLPRPLAYGISATTEQGVVCVGGSDSQRHYADAFRLEVHNGKLVTHQMPLLPIAVSGASWAMLGEVLYVACGSEEPGEQTATNRTFALDLSASEPAWQELPALPGKPRLLAAGAAHDGAFYVFGGAALTAQPNGKAARVYLTESWAYRPVKGWTRLADLPKPCVAAPSPAPVLEGRILLISGDDGSKVGFEPVEKHPGFPATILAYDPARNAWSEGGETPAPRATVPCLKWGERIVIPSGEVRPGVRSPAVWSFTSR